MNIQSSRQAGGAKRTWQNGEIAFLKSSNYFLPKDYQDLIASGHLHPKATSHPVIILQAGSGGAIVTTVTAFSSGPDNNFLPPWRMSAHREKQSDDYHAFIGTKLPPNSPNAHLKLSDSAAKMNKPRASWVYIKHFFTVPYTVLMRWDKVPQQLRVSDESLAQLRADIDRKYHSQLQIARSRLTACPMSVEPTPCHGTYQGRQVPSRPRAQRFHPKPHQSQQRVLPTTGAPPTQKRHPAWVPQHSNYRRDATHYHTIQNSCRQAVSQTAASVHPAMMHSWRRPITT